MSILPVVNQIIMLFIIAALGFMLRRMKVFTDPVIKGVNSTVILITWPAMMIMTTQKDYDAEVLKGFFGVFTASLVILSVFILITFFCFSKMKDKGLRPVMTMLAVMPNSGYIGLPIIQAVYGDAGALYLAAYLVGFNLVLWTLCVSICTGFTLKSLKGMLNPGLIAAIVGIALFLLKIKLPSPVLSAVNQLGSLNTPLAMLLLGARMDTLTLKKLLDGPMWITVALKLVVIPILALYVLKALGMPPLALGVAVLATAMPSASACQMLAEKYDLGVDFAARGVLVSTLLCIVTIPLMLTLIR